MYTYHYHHTVIHYIIIMSIVCNSYSVYFLHISKNTDHLDMTGYLLINIICKHDTLGLVQVPTEEVPTTSTTAALELNLGFRKITGQGATYVTTHVWPLWQCGPFVRLLPWSRCKEDPPGSKTRRKLHVSYDNMTSNDICIDVNDVLPCGACDI